MNNSTAEKTDIGQTSAKSKSQRKAERRLLQNQKDGVSKQTTQNTSQQNATKDETDAKQAMNNSSADTASIGQAAPKSKSQLKAERRAIQEAQRAAKAAGTTPKAGDQGQKAPVSPQKKVGEPPQKPVSVKQAASKEEAVKIRVPAVNRQDEPSQQRKLIRDLVRKGVPPRPMEVRQAPLFSHLPQPDRRCCLFKGMKLGPTGSIHPAFLKLGQRMDEGLVCGSDMRLFGLMNALLCLIDGYVRPPNVDWARDMIVVLNRHVTFLDQCRPLAVSMLTLIARVKKELNKMNETSETPETPETAEPMSDAQCAKKLSASIQDFFEECLRSSSLICENMVPMVREDDLIVVYSYCRLVADALVNTWNKGRRFKVLVVDSRPHLKGRTMVEELLVKHKIPCTYILITALPSFMNKVSSVMIGAFALLNNGYLISKMGTGSLCNMADHYHKPVIVLCESYKLWDRAQTDAFEWNEICDPDLLGYKGDWRKEGAPLPLVLAHDVINPEKSVMVVTELGIIPPTSFPVIMRLKGLGAV